VLGPGVVGERVRSVIWGGWVSKGDFLGDMGGIFKQRYHIWVCPKIRAFGNAFGWYAPFSDTPIRWALYR